MSCLKIRMWLVHSMYYLEKSGKEIMLLYLELFKHNFKQSNNFNQSNICNKHVRSRELKITV